MPNWANACSFRVSGVIFSRRLCSDSCRIRPRRCLSFPFNSTSWFFQIYASSEIAGRSRQSLRFPAASVKTSVKKPPRGRARGGVVAGRRKRGLPSTRPACEIFSQTVWLSVRFATLEPGNCFDYPLLSGHAVSYVGPGESRLSSASAPRRPPRANHMNDAALGPASIAALRDAVRNGREPPPARIVARLKSYRWFVVGTVCVGAFMGQVDSSIAQMLLPRLEVEFGARLSTVSWVAVAYLLAMAAFLPVFGRLADMVGRKLLYTGGFLLFVLSSALCGLAPSLPVLIAFRIAQGIGAALLSSNSVAIVVTAAGPCAPTGIRL